ncbi:hypothetical protein, partial [Anaerophaga thermohalophila]|uniref:hypothetical protein n=1 Tax=Anaerophaga thermohalophila TaxID=177400 RepID=UPI0005C5B722
TFYIMSFFQYLKNTRISKNEKNGFIAKSPFMVTESTDSKQLFKIKRPPLVVLFPDVSTGYDYPNFQADLKQEIEKMNHIYSEEIGICIIIFFNFLREKELRLSSERLWHHLLNNYFTTCNVQLEYPMKIRLDKTFSPLKLKTIEVKKLDGDDLKRKLKTIPCPIILIAIWPKKSI